MWRHTTLLIVLTVTSSCFIVGALKSNSLTHVVDRQRRSVSADQQKQIVDIHNAVRRCEGASDMQLMTWNDVLATLAEKVANSCKWEHSQPSVPNQPFDGYGQNLYATTVAPLNVTGGIVQWYIEKRDYNYDTLKCTPGQMCGHYTQVVWAESRQVGCAYKFCDTLAIASMKKANFFVCNYEPQGNYVGAHPFKKGKACSECPNGADSCTRGLCTPTGVKPGMCPSMTYYLATIDDPTFNVTTSEESVTPAATSKEESGTPTVTTMEKGGTPAATTMKNCTIATGDQRDVCADMAILTKPRGLGSTVTTQRPLLYSLVITAVILFTRCQL